MQVNPQSLGGAMMEAALVTDGKPCELSEPRPLSTGAEPDLGWFFLGLQFGVSRNPS